MPTANAIASNFSKQSVERIAAVAAERSNYVQTNDIYDAVDALGGSVRIRDFWKGAEHTGSLIVNGVADFTVFIPSHTSQERDRFTIAHELGHYFLHYLFLDKASRPSQLRADRYGSGRVEWEANWFAGAFLMPADRFKSVYETEGGELFAVADEFAVSDSAVRVRAKSLGLLDGSVTL